MRIKYNADIDIDDIDINGPKCPDWELTSKIEQKVDSIAKKMIIKSLKLHNLKCNNFYNNIIGLSDDGEYNCQFSFNITDTIDINFTKELKFTKSIINNLEESIEDAIKDKLSYLKDSIDYNNILEVTLKDWEIL